MPHQSQMQTSEEDWAGLTSTAERRKLQNRLNQRAHSSDFFAPRRRKRLEESTSSTPCTGTRRPRPIHSLAFFATQSPHSRLWTTTVCASTWLCLIFVISTSPRQHFPASGPGLAFGPAFPTTPNAAASTRSFISGGARRATSFPSRPCATKTLASTRRNVNDFSFEY
ncbi:hypothetical protein BKA56DRAFT_624315 [Ilyonectria sp. MPI-CAGE-AT-0026]|nr:hypothetical protein BKA56DRAFT_624315 [Ilyonectria sp. MPI-CAGE-AT-0026]